MELVSQKTNRKYFQIHYKTLEGHFDALTGPPGVGGNKNLFSLLSSNYQI